MYITLIPFRFYIIVIFSCIYLVSCSDTPRSQQYHDAVQQLFVSEQYKSIYLIRNIKKRNGYALDEFYYAEMEFDRIFLVSIDDAIKMLDTEVQQSKSVNLLDELSKGLYALASQSGILKVSLIEQYGRFAKGDRITEKITLKFLKTEQGWRLYTK